MVFASLSFWADVSGILGLVIGVIGLRVTVWTFCKVQTVEDALKSYKRKRSFGEQLPRQLRELKRISPLVSDAAYPENPGQSLDIPSLLGEIERVLNICEEITLDDIDCLISPDKVSTLLSLCRTVSDAPSHNRMSLRQELKPISQKINALVGEIKNRQRKILTEVANES
jgi:hypothetical protein